MKTLEQLRINPRLTIEHTAADGGCGKITFPFSNSKTAIVIFSWDGGWDHVSVSYPNRCLTWEEMCQVKKTFFNADECVVQYHPAEADYVNIHPYCLHLWKPQSAEFLTPPKWMVG